MSIAKESLLSHRTIQEEAHALMKRLRQQVRFYLSDATVIENPHILEAFVTSLGKLHGLLNFLDVECERLEDEAYIGYDEELNVVGALYDAFRCELDAMQLLLASRHLTSGNEPQASREFANQT